MELTAPIRFQPRITLLATLIALSLMTGCSGPPFKAYKGPELPDDQVAILDWSHSWRATVIEIDGKRLPFEMCLSKAFLTGRPSPPDQARLLPGKHTIVYVGHVDAGGPRQDWVRTTTLDMKPGHRYAVMAENNVLLGAAALWIVDQTTGEVVAAHGSRGLGKRW